jgi:hypothetical protein
MRCEVSDLPKDQCSHCLGQDAPDDNPYDIAYRFVANFSSTGDCGHRINAGDYAAKTKDPAEYICEGCAS